MADDKKTGETIAEADIPEAEVVSETPGPEQDPAEEAQTEEAQTEEDASVETSSDFDTDAVIEAFGGIRPMATKLDVAVSTVQGWKTRGHIPENRWRDIIAAASAHNIDLSGALPSEESSEEDASPWEKPETETPEPAAEAEAVVEEASEPVKETAKETPKAPAPLPAQKSSSGGGLGFLLGLIAIAAVVTRPAWAPHVDPHVAKYLPIPAPSTGQSAGGSADQSDLISTLEALQARIAELEARPVATGEGGATIPGDLLPRISALEEGLAAMRTSAESLSATASAAETALAETQAALEASVERDEVSRERLVERMGVLDSLVQRISEEAERATASLAGLEARIAAQDAEIAALEARPAIQGAAQAGLALAVGDIEAALATGRPFDGAVARIAQLGGSGSDVAIAAEGLALYAENGVLTRAALIAAFQQDAPTMQSELGRGDGTVVETLLDGAKSLISVRRKGESPDAPPISRAEAALDRGDLSSAIAALSPEAAGSATLASWLQKAEARLASEEALSALRSAVAVGLTPPGNASNEEDPS